MRKRYYLAGSVAVAIIGLLFVLQAPTKQAAPSQMSHGRYVALGDSVAAGVGLETYSDASACDRTNQSYPAVLAAKLQLTLRSSACSGATTDAGLLGPQTVNRLVLPKQLDSTLQGAKPALVTITIGANDAHWTSYIQKCYSATCGSESDTADAQQAIASAMANLAQALGQIGSRYPSKPPIVLVTGYYKLFGATSTLANCTETTGLEPSEINWIGQLQDNINQALQTTTAQYAWATYVPINFTGHELCTETPGIQGLTAKAPFHPTDAGQEAIATQLAKSVQGKIQ